MGMYSWECRACGLSVLNTFVVDSANAWLNDVVAVLPGGKTVSGGYDGYGRVLESDGDLSDITDKNPDVYHKACWELVGAPTKHEGGSRSARDQGHFFEEGTYRVSEPKSREDVEKLRKFTTTPEATTS